MIATTPAREIQRNYTRIFERVRRTKQPIIVETPKGPQVAIMPLEDMEELTKLRQKEALDSMKVLAQEIAEAHKDHPLPSDMVAHHDRYFYEAWEEEQRTKQRP